MFLVPHVWNALDWTFLVLLFALVCAIAVQMDCTEVY
jgi:hypothetical protein